MRTFVRGSIILLAGLLGACGGGRGPTKTPPRADYDMGDSQGGDGPSANCGNGRIEGAEVCDGANLGGQTCASRGFASGTLRCNADCRGFNTSQCESCGNDQKDPGEICDGEDLGDKTCVALGFEGGTLACDRSCEAFDTVNCVGRFTCGDGEVDSPEVCDKGEPDGDPPVNLNGSSCRTLGYDSGSLGCEDDCMTFDEANCVTSEICGNNNAAGPEKCDGTDLDGKTCVTLGYTGGTLACKPDCRGFIETGCTGTACGNNRKETGEACDGTDLGGQTCITQGYSGGTLRCKATCEAFDFASCTGAPTCGNNQATGTETCDGSDLKGKTCQSLGYTGGNLACNATCTGYVTTACTGTPRPQCGDGVARGLEVCDGSSWQLGPACTDFNMGTGNATCTNDCKANFSACENPDLCAANGWYEDGWCDACDLLGGTVDPDCAAVCTQADGTCSDYFDAIAGVYTCQHQGLTDPDCGTCGDGVAEEPELCDGTDFGGYGCADYGFASGDLSCAADCTLSFAGCAAPACGNNVAEGTEVCDGTDLAEQTCASLGFVSGNLACKADCTDFDTRNCVAPTCGNTAVEVGEVCDGGNLNGYTCQRLGFGPGGTLTCGARCDQFVVSGCTAKPAAASCGDDVVNGLSICDGGTFGFDLTGDCTELGYESGTFTCNDTTCRLNLGSCVGADGDDFCAAVGYYEDGYCDACDLLGGTVDPDCGTYCPVADGVCSDFYDALAGAWTCRHLGYVDPDCGACGNNTLEGSEYCDGTAAAALTCADAGYVSGTITCAADCTPAFPGGCTAATCGNNTVETGEECDGTNLDGKNCAALGFAGGTLSCTACAFNTTNCTNKVCGNNTREGDEACDGNDLNGLTCQLLGFATGSLACAGDCRTFNLAGCSNTVGSCGNGVLDGVEYCDTNGTTTGTDDVWAVGPACSEFNLGTGTATCRDNCTPSFTACQSQDYCLANNYYNDGWCDACDMLGGVVDDDCAVACEEDDFCADYYDIIAGVWTCQHLGYTDPDCGTCPNGTIDGNEWCDGTQLGGFTCADFGYAPGNLTCKADCTFDFTACDAADCGNNVIEGYEYCDGTAVGGLTCVDFGYTGGTLLCGTDCQSFLFTSCAGEVSTSCNNGVVDGLEVCDGSAWLVGPACSEFYYGGMGTGTATCVDCRPSFDGCQEPDLCTAEDWYGDGWCDACELLGGIVDEDCATSCEVADGYCVDYYDVVAAAWTCGHLGYTDPDCGTCGNNTIEGYEYCDGTQFGGTDCTDYGFAGGTLTCATTCIPDFTQCDMIVCGDGVVEGTEVCDGANLNGETCESQGFAGGGTLLCNSCTSFNITGCQSSAWTCPASYYDAGDGCDCGCGIVDPDCDDSTAASCDYCNDTGTCNTVQGCPGEIDPVNNAQCGGVTVEWTCDASYYDDGYFCDCGCGVFDPDCGTDHTLAACDYCDNVGSCADLPCDDANVTIDPSDNAVCTAAVPAAWRCDPDFYDDGDCDCGCGAIDADCASTAASACEFCGLTGSCGVGSCPANIKTDDNSTCTRPTSWTCSTSYYGAADGCDCGCGALDPDCSAITGDVCDYCLTGSCSAVGCGDIDPDDNTACL